MFHINRTLSEVIDEPSVSKKKMSSVSFHDDNVEFALKKKQIHCAHTSCLADPLTNNYYRLKNRKGSKPVLYCHKHRYQNTTDFFYDQTIIVLDAEA
jgi:hypothetical protein